MNIRTLAIGVVFAAIVGLSSCDFIASSGNDEGESIARVYDQYLSKGELAAIIPTGTDSLDSTILAKNYVNTWIETQLMVKRAELNLNEDQLNFEDQLRQYRNNLIIYTYEQALITQKLDTSITEEEIKAYYEENSQNFELLDYVVKPRWVKVDKSAPKLKKIRKILDSEELKDQEELEDYCYQFAAKCFLDDAWVYYDEFVNDVPIETMNVEEFLKSNRSFEIESNNFLYLVFINEYKLKNSVSPLDLERNRVKNIILNKRKLQLLGSIREGLLEEGLDKNNVEFY